MSKKSLVILTAAASVCTALSAYGQVVQPTPGVPGDYALPEGSAKTLVQENCTICHNLRNVVNSNKSQEDWKNTVNMMKAAGAPIDDAQAEQIKSYLIANFPEKPRPKPAVIARPGPASSSKYGRYRRRARAPMIRWRRPTARCGGRDSSPTGSDGSTPRPAR